MSNSDLSRRNLVQHGLLAAAGVAGVSMSPGNPAASASESAPVDMAALANVLGPLPAGSKIARIATWLTGATSGTPAALKTRLANYDGGTLQVAIPAGFTWQDTLASTIEALHTAITNLLGGALFPSGNPRPIDQFEKCMIECAIDKMPASPSTQPLTEEVDDAAEEAQEAVEGATGD